MADTTTKLDVTTRAADGSRAARRLRRSGRVPGVLYGGDGESVGFDADARELRLALASSGAVLDLSLDGAKPTPVVLKEAQRDPVRGQTVHVDLLRVRLDQAIHAVVPLELVGIDDAPGVKEGGVLEQITRELNVEALPRAIPDAIVHEGGEMQIGARRPAPNPRPEVEEEGGPGTERGGEGGGEPPDEAAERAGGEGASDEE